MKTKHRKFNYVDLLLLITALIILMVFISVFFKNSSQIDFTQKETITVTLRVRDIPAKHSNLIKNGDEIYFLSDESVFGKVKYVSYDSETVEFLDKLTNTSTTYKSPDKKTALLLVDVDVEIIDGRYFVSGYEMIKGDSVDVFVPSFVFSPTIVSIENVKE